MFLTQTFARIPIPMKKKTSRIHFQTKGQHFVGNEVELYYSFHFKKGKNTFFLFIHIHQRKTFSLKDKSC